MRVYRLSFCLENGIDADRKFVIFAFIRYIHILYAWAGLYLCAVLQPISPMTNLYAIVIIVHLILHHTAVRSIPFLPLFISLSCFSWLLSNYLNAFYGLLSLNFALAFYKISKRINTLRLDRYATVIAIWNSILYIWFYFIGHGLDLTRAHWSD